MRTSVDIQKDICNKCGAPNDCGSSECWCSQYPPILIADLKKSCLCNQCMHVEVKEKIKEFLTDLTPKKKEEIKALGTAKKTIEGIDYEINKEGLLVFSSWYHLRRGSCCDNVCLNCPYKE